MVGLRSERHRARTELLSAFLRLLCAIFALSQLFVHRSIYEVLVACCVGVSSHAGTLHNKRESQRHGN